MLFLEGDMVNQKQSKWKAWKEKLPCHCMFRNPYGYIKYAGFCRKQTRNVLWKIETIVCVVFYLPFEFWSENRAVFTCKHEPHCTGVLRIDKHPNADCKPYIVATTTDYLLTDWRPAEEVTTDRGENKKNCKNCHPTNGGLCFCSSHDLDK